jgi:RecB family exonuclease
VLPNKRGALFLKQHLAAVYQKNIWLPSIISAEDLISELSGTQSIEDIDLMCRLYESYKGVFGENAESFDSFAKWGNLILQDFNEIDRYLVDAPALYSNLQNIKEIENWSLSQEELTPFQQNYLHFMARLGEIYIHLTDSLLASGQAYQGLAYKEAVKKFEQSSFTGRFHKIIFCGFNALNKAETLIFSKLCNSGKAEILWDADHYYLNDKVQEAGIFLRRNLELFHTKEPKFIGNHFKEEKDIEIISVPKQIGQAQTIRKILEDLLAKGTRQDSIALVLANEKLLWPVLKLLPDGIEHVNITMEYPLKYSSAYTCIDLLLKIQLAFQNQGRKERHIYYKDFLSLARHPFFREYLQIEGIKNTDKTIEQVNNRNYAFITKTLMQELYGEDFEKIKNLLDPWHTSKYGVEAIRRMLTAVKEAYLGSELTAYKSLELEYLEVLIRNFNRAADFVIKYTYFDTIKPFKVLFNQVVGTSTAAFIGEPLRGLQIMGVLETRTLDFENVIFVSVNEGVLPSGKSQNSFIPNDLKRHFGLPLYGDKDAIYAYHFYRLLQRTKNCFITYDSETDAFGKGEKSRFVSQLQSELSSYNPNIKINEQIAISSIFSGNERKPFIIPKTEESLKSIAEKAFSNEEFHSLSPSSLIVFKDCSLKFFFRYGAGIKESVELEESAEANTFGSILHEILEALYTPFINKNITAKDLEVMKKKVLHTVEDKFLGHFSKNDAFMGKNLLQQNVLKVYTEKLINMDMSLVSKLGDTQLFITALEKEMAASVQVDQNGKPTTVYIKGKADRIDKLKNTTRILDYKSSIRPSDKFEFAGFDSLFEDKNYDKMLQLFMYAWLAWKNKISTAEELRPAIIPFKKFEKEPRYISLKDKAPLQFTDALLTEFESHLSSFVMRIFDEKVDFLQTEEEAVCEYCAYNIICHKN